MVASIRYYCLYSTDNGRQHKTCDVRAERHGFPLVLELHDLEGGNNDVTLLYDILFIFLIQECVARFQSKYIRKRQSKNLRVLKVSC
jgi:hypothetical protein